MSFLLDPPLLVAGGAVLERLAPSERAADRIASLTITTFLGVSTALWNDNDSPLLEPIWRPFGSSSPRDFMINSGVLDLPVPRRPSRRDQLLASAMFATYPMWLSLGRRVGRRWRARST
jgi:hypothetical protein